MGGDIWLDEDFDSGVDGCPGSRFVLDLNAPPSQVDESYVENMYKTMAHEEGRDESKEDNDRRPLLPQQPAVPDRVQQQGLPDTLRVLFVDDDLVLRKMFCRSLKRVAPNWALNEAANGETAIQLVDDNEYDLIILDQYSKYYALNVCCYKK